MYKKYLCCLFLSILSTLSGFNVEFDPVPTLHINEQAARKMGQQIWQNESGGRIEGLTAWNEGEEFASLGIGHFIWYPTGSCTLFKETFPSLMEFFKSTGAFLPEWLNPTGGCPWETREKFLSAKQSPRMIELREMLKNRINLQVRFMVDRMQRALPYMIRNLNENMKKHVTNQFYRLASTGEGLFVLLDYINFKGEGASVGEQYNGKGWGLLQVLERMPNQTNETSAINEFVMTAKQVLQERIKNSPPERNEEKWLKGWSNRLDSYLYFTI